ASTSRKPDRTRPVTRRSRSDCANCPAASTSPRRLHSASLKQAISTRSPDTTLSSSSRTRDTSPLNRSTDSTRRWQDASTDAAGLGPRRLAETRLRAGVEKADRLNLVAEEFQAIRGISIGREDIKDAAAAAELAW